MVFVDALSSSDSDSSTSSSSRKRAHAHLEIRPDHWTPIVGGPPTASTSKGDDGPPSGASELVPLCEQDTEEGDLELVPVEQKVSIYVQCFQDILNTVLEHEQFLFDENELQLLKAWIDKLSNYEAEIGNVLKACEDLGKPIAHYSNIDAIPQLASTPKPPALLETLISFNVVSSTTAMRLDENDEMILDLPPIPAAVPIRYPSTPYHPSTPSSSTSFIAALSSPDQDETQSPPLTSFATVTSSVPIESLDLEELLNCLTVQELKQLARQHRTNPHTTRDMIIKGLIEGCKNQSTLFRTDKKLGLKFDEKGRKQKQNVLLIPKVLKMIGHAIKLSPNVCNLFSRLHLIYNRTNHPPTEQTLTAPLLASFKLRSDQNYTISRSKISFFKSRRQVLEFEEALNLERELDDCLSSVQFDQQRGKALDLAEEREMRRAEKEKRMKRAHEIFQSVWVKWKEAVEMIGWEQQQQQHPLVGSKDGEEYYRRQFEPAHILTRIVNKSTEILSYYKNYSGEIEILVSLLKQVYFLRGKRGEWYDRLALILMTHLPDTSKKQDQRYSLEICDKALNDSKVHEVYRLAITKRKNRLLKLLSLQNLDQDSEMIFRRGEGKVWSRQSVLGSKVSFDENVINRVGKKTIWKSMIDHGSLISVEELVLEHYCGLSDGSWRGFHSEGSIITTLYALVFWDVLFADVPGAFQTAYQSAPLDLTSDAFSIVRAPLIEERMNLIDQNGISEISTRVKETYERESIKKSWCIGLNWERYGLDELLEIVECFGVRPMKKLLKVLSQEYGYRRGGVPDLCLWNYAQKKIKFVEVKGPGDRLSDTQIAWLELLGTGLGVDVEVCDVKNDV